MVRGKPRGIIQKRREEEKPNRKAAEGVLPKGLAALEQYVGIRGPRS